MFVFLASVTASWTIDPLKVDWYRRLPAVAFLRKQPFLCACLAIILLVSAIDTWLVYLFRDTILIDEKNPICRRLIAHDPHQLSWFFWGKGMGNLFVVSTLILLYRFDYRHCRLVASSVAGFQLLLSCYLGLSDATSGFLHFDWAAFQREHPPEFWGQLIVSNGVALVMAAWAITFWNRSSSTIS